jgi:hypothetical protein
VTEWGGVKNYQDMKTTHECKCQFFHHTEMAAGQFTPGANIINYESFHVITGLNCFVKKAL